MRINHRFVNRRFVKFECLALCLVIVLTVTASRLRADTCNGQSITLPFTDVSGNLLFCQIAAAYFAGLVEGTTPTTYNPSGNVTRDLMAASATRTLDQSLKRGSRRAALDQWATPTSIPFTGKTTVGNSPVGVKSDGADVWVANYGSDTVSRVRASDGKLLETWTGATGAYDVVIARGRVFVVGYGTSQLYVIDPRQPAGVVTTLTNSLPGTTSAITFDGFYLWTTSGSSVCKVNPNTGAVTTIPGFASAQHLTYDGAHIWVSDLNDNKVKKLDSFGSVLATVSITSPEGLVFDGTNLWVTDITESAVKVVRVRDLQGNPLSAPFVLATLTGNGLNHPGYAAFDGERVLVTNFNGNSVSLWRASDLAPLGTASGANSPTGVCSDGLNFWIANYYSTPGELLRF